MIILTIIIHDSTANNKDQLDAQLGQLTAQLAQLSGDRRRSADPDPVVSTVILLV